MSVSPYKIRHNSFFPLCFQFMCTIFLSFSVTWARQLLNCTFKDDCFRLVKKRLWLRHSTFKFYYCKPHLMFTENPSPRWNWFTTSSRSATCSSEQLLCLCVQPAFTMKAELQRVSCTRCRHKATKSKYCLMKQRLNVFQITWSRVAQIPGSPSSWPPTFCRVAHNICGSSAWHLPHIVLLAHRILRWLIHF